MIPPADSTPVFHVPEGVNLNKEQVHAIRTMNRNFAQAYAAALDPIRAGTVVAQGGSNLTTAITQNGGCPGVASITNLAWLTPIMTPLQIDRLGRPVPASPQPGHIIQTYTIRGSNRYGQGRYLKQLEKLPFISEHYVGPGLVNTPYPKFDIYAADGTTLLYPAQPDADPVVNAHQTDLNMAAEAHSVSHDLSGMTKVTGDDNRGIAVDTGDVHSKDWAELPDPTTRVTGLKRVATSDPKRSLTVVNPDDTTMRINPTTNELEVVAGASGSRVSAHGNTTSSETIDGATEAAVQEWAGVEYDIGGFWSSGNPTRLTAPATGEYHISVEGYAEWVAAWASAGCLIFLSDSSGAGIGTIRDFLAPKNRIVATANQYNWSLSLDVHLPAGGYAQVVHVVANNGEGPHSVAPNPATDRLVAFISMHSLG